MELLPKICLFLSFVTLGNMGLQTFHKLEPETYFYLNALDTFICGSFLTLWSVRLWEAPNKLKFLKWGWIDLLLAIPFSHGIWTTYHSIIRAARCIRSAKYIFEYFDKDEKTTKFVDCCVFCVGFIIFSSIMIFNCEKHVENANIKNMSDAVWWTLATITTIGYGDRFPVSDIGRCVGGIVMIGGVGLYASFTGFIVSKFINDHRIDKLVTDNDEMKIMLKLLTEKKEVDK